MRVALLIAVILAALVAIGWWLVPLVIAHAPGLVGAAGVLLLLVALLLPAKPACTGMHCSGCDNH